MLYSISRDALFCLDAERAHELTLAMFSRFPVVSTAAFRQKISSGGRTVMGLDFPNPVGLAAGLDKNGECIRAWQALGFGFIEVGTVTPRPQPGNPRPRMFRLPQQQALINRLGFNNKGVDYLIRQVDRSGYRGILGVNIGKNFDTPLERARDDYLHCLEKAYSRASYITVNISSPNTQGLRDLQKGEALDPLLSSLKAAQQRLCDQHSRYVPIAVKIAPDMDNQALGSVADSLRRHAMDAVIATNTTISRPGLKGVDYADEQGGLSGSPLCALSTDRIRALGEMLAGELPIIGAGGILEGADAAAKCRAGAELVQIYTGFIYRGPALIRESAEAIAAL